MTGEEAFEFAAAVAGVSLGVTAILVLAVLSVVGVWRLFRHASDAQQAALRAAVTVEDLVRGAAGAPTDDARLAEWQQQLEQLALQQRQLQDSVRALVDTGAPGGSQERASIAVLEAKVDSLDASVGQMATSLANLIRVLEQRQGR